MSDEEQGPDDKPHEPSQKRLEDARKKGELARSADLTTAGGYVGFVIAGLAASGAIAEFHLVLRHMLEDPVRLSREILGDGAGPVVGQIALAVTVATAIWFVLPFLGAFLAVLAQRALVFAPTKLVPKVERVSPIKGAQNKFGRAGLFEFAKSAAKLIVFSACLGVYVLFDLGEMLGASALDARAATLRLFTMMLEFAAIICVVAGVIGSIDYLWQRAEHLRQNRMSRKDMTDEARDAEGDPQMKGRRRQRALDIATNRMIADVPSADVVIVNPSHYAVALRWDRASRSAPRCVAKGVDEVAHRIRAEAAAAGVPIRRDPPTARALYAAIGLNEEITPEHYMAVAAAIRFADTVRSAARAQR